MNERLLSVEHSMKRLDVWLADQLPEHSRSAIRRLFRSELVSVDGAIVKPCPSRHVKVRLFASLSQDPEPIELIPEAILLEIAYEDEWLLVVNKPQGWSFIRLPGTVKEHSLMHCLRISVMIYQRYPV